ncbi:MAG: glycosyltransferase family 2 protein [Lachnospiraceae bacterium]|nr:glycosyltransferase family 2 protein [Lachnospiraceae bacterium]MBR4174984.1 glycosyltransferase family 2 protein [Lachnospiraceae bacterium]
MSRKKNDKIDKGTAKIAKELPVQKNGKKISVMIPCYNEVENVVPMSEAVCSLMEKELPAYDYELLFIDNCSTDGTRKKLEEICAKNKKVKAILNMANFGQFNSPFYGMCRTDGDCTISMCCDFQDPVELIPVFVKEWENGHRIVSGVKTSSKENPIIYFMRSVYYKMIRGMSDVEMIEHFTGFGLYDKTFIDLLRNLNDNTPFLRGIVAEYGHGFNKKEIEYEQKKRRAGKTHNNFYSLYDAAMLSITSYTKVLLRLATFLGFISSGVSLLIALIYLILKLTHWHQFTAGYAPMVIGVFVLGSLQLFFIGLLGEYILNINTRVINRPLVVEERRLNFDEPEKTQDEKRDENKKSEESVESGCEQSVLEK